MYTVVQKRMIDLLADGLSHPVSELHKCLWDEMSKPTSVAFHISNLRAILRPLGQDIICRSENGTYCYIHVRLIRISECGPSKTL